MLFGIYLVENGVLSAEDFVEAVKLSQHSRPQIGALAIQMRLLSCRQVFSILDAQCDAPQELFGETAVRLGYLSQEDLWRLLALQGQRAQPFDELLIENRFLPREVVEHHKRAYRRCMSESPRPELAAI